MLVFADVIKLTLAKLRFFITFIKYVILAKSACTPSKTLRVQLDSKLNFQALVNCIFSQAVGMLGLF